MAFGLWFAFAGADPVDSAPAVGAAPPVIIAALSDHPSTPWWLIIAFTVLQQLEGHVVAPNVFGQALRINPLLVIFALLLQAAKWRASSAPSSPCRSGPRSCARPWSTLHSHLTFQRWDLPAERPPPRVPGALP